MKQIKAKLKNPLSGLGRENMTSLKKRFYDIAKTLFEDYCFKCDTKIFRFAEIEFYYYKKDHSNSIQWDDEWNEETYPRNKDAGELFFHYSGVDICFQCRFDEDGIDDNVEFGGILIRSIIEVDNSDRLIKLHAGPQYCANLMLNSCKNQLPELVKAKHMSFDKLEQTVRFGINCEEKQKEQNDNLELCYYINQFNGVSLKWKTASERFGWDMKNGKYKLLKRNYKRERFKDID